MDGMEKIAGPLRVCLTGAESTGKTELAKELALHFSARLVPEYSREYALARATELSYSDVGPIAHGQVAAEDRAAAGAGELVILDTDVLSTVVYSRHHFGACPQWIESLARTRIADLYLLLDIDVPWVWDPVRDSRDTRDTLHDDFRRALEEFGAKYTVISGKWDERWRRSVDAIDAARV
jgi:NadR type nicotinamide-nucleotide adenylyltransferase